MGEVKGVVGFRRGGGGGGRHLPCRGRVVPAEEKICKEGTGIGNKSGRIQPVTCHLLPRIVSVSR